jgi:hypothetical protein
MVVALVLAGWSLNDSARGNEIFHAPEMAYYAAIDTGPVGGGDSCRHGRLWFRIGSYTGANTHAGSHANTESHSYGWFDLTQ